MQLAMLAPYNNLASSVAAALVPTLLTPKIKITDENEQSFSYASENNHVNDPPSRRMEDIIDEGKEYIYILCSLLLSFFTFIDLNTAVLRYSPSVIKLSLRVEKVYTVIIMI